jgi:hypothetical protein
MKTICLTNSYTLTLPDDVASEVDDRVFSWWLAGNEALLQISSYSRSSGAQFSARERLNARRQQTKFLKDDTAPRLSTDCPDIAFASGIDSEGMQWHYYYLVWPDLTIFATVSGPTSALLDEGSWIISALNSLKRSL